MVTAWRLFSTLGLLLGLTGCFSISLPKKIVINEGGARSKPAPQKEAPPTCDLSDLPIPAPAERPSLAVLDFQFGENMKADVGRALADLCRDAIHDTGRFLLVDRERIADVLGERDFADAVRCDTVVCYVEYGKLLGARQMMHGRINQLGEVYVLAVGMTEIETGQQISRSMSLERIEDSADAIPELVCRIIRSASADSGNP